METFNIENYETVCKSSTESDNEITIIQELKNTFDDHDCELCCKGNFLMNKLLHFGGSLSSTRKHACEICFRGFKTKSDLSNHAKVHKDNIISAELSTSDYNKSSECQFCATSCKSDVGLQRHVTLKHPELLSQTKIHTCDICLKNFSDIRKFNRHCTSHMSSVKRKKLMTCKICKKKFFSDVNFKKHVCTIE